MLLTTFAGVCANAAPVMLDFSHSHTVEDLKRSGLIITKIGGGLQGQAYSFQNQEVKIYLPANRSITQRVNLGTIDTKGGRLTQFSVHGYEMPQSQAFQVAQMFMQSFSIPLNKLNNWNGRNLHRELSSDGFEASPIMTYYPIVGIALSSSQNKLYPWTVRFEIQWDWKEQRDWNEERAWRELPTPAIASISLEPPSGLTYDPHDAYKDTLEAQKKFEQEQAAKRAVSTTASHR